METTGNEGGGEEVERRKTKMNKLKMKLENVQLLFLLIFLHIQKRRPSTEKTGLRKGLLTR